jgi:hypothetical protein
MMCALARVNVGEVGEMDNSSRLTQFTFRKYFLLSL